MNLDSDRIAARILDRLMQPLVIDGARVSLTCGSARFSLQTMPVEEYPELVGLKQAFGHSLPEVPLAYPTDWGIEWGDGLRVDVWAEMALANLILPARRLRGEGR